MNRREKLRLIKGLIRGSITSVEPTSQIEIWIEEPGKDLFKNIQSGKILTREELDKRKLNGGNSKLIVMEFKKEISVLSASQSFDEDRKSMSNSIFTN